MGHESRIWKQSEYAARRGVSQAAVSKAISSGRLKECLNAQRQIVDADLADIEWARNTDLTDAPASVVEQSRTWAGAETDEGDEASFANAGAREKYWKAKSAELKFKQDAGELVRAAEVEARMSNVFAVCKTKLLGIPARARQQLPHLTLADLAVLESLIRESLEALADGR